MGTLADLVGGFQQGYDHSRGAVRDKKLNRLIDYETERMDLENSGKYGKTNELRQMAGMEPLERMDFGDQDTYGQKLVGWFKGLFSKEQPQAIDPTAVSTYAAPQAEQGFQFEKFADGGMPKPYRMAHGGSVRATEIAAKNAENLAAYKAKAAERALSPSQIAERKAAVDAASKSKVARAGSAIRSGVNKAGKVVAPLAIGAAALDTKDTSTEDYRERFALGPRSSASQTEEEVSRKKSPTIGGALGDKEFYGDLATRAAGAASDLGNVLTFGQAGKLFRDKQDDKTAAIQALPVDEPVEQAALKVAAQPSGPSVGGAASPPQPTSSQGASPSEFDWGNVDAMPEDMPTMSTDEWADKRYRMMAAYAAAGDDPAEASKLMDRIQMGGFQRHAGEALNLLQAGNAAGASRALKAAYQYFPNGVDVKFGMMKGVDGQPVLVGMGTDEKTGKAVKKGQPMILTAERLSVMIENMSNPDAFRTWTKDWREDRFKDKKYEEVDKPEAQSMAIYRDRAGKAAMLGAAAKLKGASGTSGLKQSDYDRGYTFFSQSQELRELEDPAAAEYLADVMSRAYQRNPQTPFPSIKALILDAYRAGELEQLVEEYGLR